MQRILQKLLLSRDPENELKDASLIHNLLKIEEYLGEKFYLFIRYTIIILFSLGYMVERNSLKYNSSVETVILLVVSVQVFIVLLYHFSLIFSRKVITVLVSVDALCLLSLFFAVAYFMSFKTAVNSEPLVYLHIIFLVTQVVRISKFYIVYTTVLLLSGRFIIYLYFKFFSEQQVHFVGSGASAILRYMSMGIIVAIIFYTTNRSKRIAFKAIKDYLLKNHLLLKNKQLLKLAIIDEVTGLYIHRYFQITLNKEMERARRHGKPLSLLLIDIDHFKDVNDTFGHQKGDEVLKEVSDIIKNESRQYDICARYGGDELAVILPATDSETAYNVAERMRHRIEEVFEPRPENVSLSIGVASANLKIEDDAAGLLASADRAMYRAKDAGRNRVVKFK